LFYPFEGALSMTRALTSLSILLLGLIVFTACQPKAPDTNRDAAKTANANTAKEAFNPVAIETEIVKIDKDWASATRRHDAETVRKILADDLVMTYPDGTIGTKADELRDIETGAMNVESWDVSDTKVTVLGPDAAFITGQAVIKNGKYKDAKSNKTIDVSGQYRFTDVYARRNGQWQAVASQTTQIANPAPAAPPAASPKASATSPK
jgi:ketosteroid isomerase-like protein